MTPETRAARDRLAAFLTLYQAIIDSGPVIQTSKDPDILGLGIPRDPGTDLAPLRASDLRLVLAALDEEPPSPPDTGKLCCCGTGTDCPACLTGRCWECPDNPERERDDEPDDWQDDDD